MEKKKSLCPLFKCTNVQEWKQADWPLCFKQSSEFDQLFFSSKYCFSRNHDMCCFIKKYFSLLGVAYIFIFFLLIFRDKHFGSYYLRVSEVWKTSVLSEVHDPKHDFFRSKHIYCTVIFTLLLTYLKPDYPLTALLSPTPCDLATIFCFYSSSPSFWLSPPPLS